jgi:hypothetical protein
MKSLKIMIPVILLVVIAATIFVPNKGMTQTGVPLFRDYQVVEVRPFKVPLNVAAPEHAGHDLANETVYQIMRYSDKFNLFEMVIMEGAQKVPAGKKVLLVKGTITAYSTRGTCAATFQFVDKASGQVLPVDETEAQGFTFRVANYIARVIYIYKVGK